MQIEKAKTRRRKEYKQWKNKTYKKSDNKKCINCELKIELNKLLKEYDYDDGNIEQALTEWYCYSDSCSDSDY